MHPVLLNALINLLIKKKKTKTLLNIPSAPKGNKIKILTYMTVFDSHNSPFIRLATFAHRKM